MITLLEAISPTAREWITEFVCMAICAAVLVAFLICL